jgi:hypothetical protein
MSLIWMMEDTRNRLETGGSFGKTESRQHQPESLRGGTQEGLRHGRVERIGNEKASRISILVIIKDKPIG